MRNSISIWACFALFFAVQLNANTTEPATIIESVSTKVEKRAERKVMEFMAGRKLEVSVNNKNNKLFVNLSGSNEKLDWIIFQPKGKVISRISTTTKIDEIKIDNLTAGKYVLMIKDASGRTLFQAFDKA